MEIVNEKITEYLKNIIPKRDRILAEMEKYGYERNFPIIGPLVGHFLFQYAKILKPKRILELGSGYGYSAMWFTLGTTKETEIICTDGSEENAKKAKEYFKKADLENRIKFLVGDAIKLMQKLEGNFDIIFCDIDKEGYPEAFNAAIPRLNIGGVMITDNTLWSGRIIDNNNNEKATEGVRNFNKLAFTDNRVHSTIIPVRDGVCITLKLANK